MPGMGMECRLEHRLEMRLEQRLTQKLVMDIVAQAPQGERFAEDEFKLLKRFIENVDAGVYFSPEDFSERFKETVEGSSKKSVEKLCSSISSVLDAYKPKSVEELRGLLSYGQDCYEKRHLAPSLEYESLESIFSARQVLKRQLMDSLIKDVNERESSNYSSLLVQLSEDRRISDEELLCALKKLEGVKAKTIDQLNADLIPSLPEKPSREQFDAALECIIEFRELIPDFYTEPVQKMVEEFSAKEDVGLLRKNYSAIPTPVLAAAVAIEMENGDFEKLQEFCRDERIAKGRDSKRRLFTGAHQLSMYRREGRKVFSHLLSISKKPEELEKLLDRIGLALTLNRQQFIEGYDARAKSFEELYGKLLEKRVGRAFGKIPITDSCRDKLLEKWDRLNPKFLHIMIRLGEIYDATYPEGLTLLSHLVEKVVDGDFKSWRYSHEKATAQLLDAANAQVWQENLYKNVILNGGEAVMQTLEALKMLGREAAEAYRQKFGELPTREHAAELHQRFMDLEELLRRPDCDQKALGIQMKELRTQYALAKAVEMFYAEPQTAEHSRAFFREKVNDKKYEMYHEVMKNGLSVLDAPEIKSMETVRIEETDDCLSVLNVGVEPVQSCQRWTESTGYNKCLLAYVIDANKKVFYLKNSSGTTHARAVVRLLPFKSKGFLMLLERPYSTCWSDDHAKALVGAGLEKAAKLSDEIGMSVRLGYSLGEESYANAFQYFAKEGEVKLMTATLDTQLPESMNFYEYSDGLGGCLKSGSRVQGCKVKYLVTHPED